MKRTEELRIVPVQKLIPYANNARTHSKEQITKLRSSLREFGFVNPVLIDKEYTIVAGHGRVLAAKEEGINEVPCVLVEHLTEAQKKAYIIADNRLAQDAGWDNELLTLELEGLKELDFDPTLTGFDAAEIDDLFSQIHDKNAKDDDYDVNKALEEASFVEAGDLWLLGRHRLLCGDATNSDNVARLMEGKKANLVVTDPPYNVDFQSSSGLSIRNDKQQDQQFYDFLLSAFKNMADHLEPGGSCYVFHADTEGLNFRNAFINAGFHLSGVCIWKKNSLVLGRSPYNWIHEPILFGWLKGGKHRWYTGRSETTVWNYDKPKKNAEHPTMKPIPLLCYPIRNSSQVNAIVLDTFGGSGSTLIACEQMDRICYMTEIDPKYATVIVKRFADQASSNDVYLVRGGVTIPYEQVPRLENKVTEGQGRVDCGTQQRVSSPRHA